MFRCFVAVFHWQIAFVQKYVGIAISSSRTQWSVFFSAFSRARFCIVSRWCVAADNDRNDSYHTRIIAKATEMLANTSQERDYTLRSIFSAKNINSRNPITNCKNQAGTHFIHFCFPNEAVCWHGSWQYGTDVDSIFRPRFLYQSYQSLPMPTR